MKFLFLILMLVFLFGCSKTETIQKGINKQEQIYQSEKAFRELERER